MYSRTYSEMMQYDNYGDRLNYLCLAGESHISPRSVSVSFYKSKPWLQTRSNVIKRDLGCDLGDMQHDIEDVIIVHHINPISEKDINEWSPKLLDPENLITTSVQTHNYIHYGQPKNVEVVERKAGDTKLW